MHVLIVTPEFPPQRGGIGTHCYEMATHWRSRAEVTVLAPESDGQHQPDLPFRLLAGPAGGGQVARALRTRGQVGRVLRECRVDVVYVAHWRASGIAVRLADPLRRLAPRYVQAVHGSEVLSLLTGRGPKKLLLRCLFRLATGRVDAFVALGTHQGLLLERLAVDRRRIVDSPEGVDVSRFEHVDGAVLDQLRARHSLGGRRVLLTVSRLVERKGHDMVIRALPAILDATPDAVYLVVGSGPREGFLRQLAEETGVAASVVFCGAVPDIELAAYYTACDVFVMPSREVDGDIEGFGITFMEAAACSKPSVGGRTGGVPEAVLDGETGLLVDPGSADQIAKAAILLLTDADLASRMGTAAKRRVVADFQYAQIAERLLDRALTDQHARHAEAASEVPS
jgi:phosphatidyl-myo-inositol dimannoside synthase